MFGWKCRWRGEAGFAGRLGASPPGGHPPLRGRQRQDGPVADEPDSGQPGLFCGIDPARSPPGVYLRAAAGPAGQEPQRHRFQRIDRRMRVGNGQGLLPYAAHSVAIAADTRTMI